MRVQRLAILAMAMMGLTGQAAPQPKYAEDQVWEYHARARDPGSLLKIQRIEAYGSAQVYHISVSGLHFGKSDALQALQHSPVSVETLDASVTKLASAEFPVIDFEGGLAEWRQAKGGIFTIPVSEIVGIIDAQIGNAQSK